MGSICEKDREPGLGQCCCNCANRYKDSHYPCTTGENITKQRGWDCFVDDEHVMF